MNDNVSTSKRSGSGIGEVAHNISHDESGATLRCAAQYQVKSYG